MNPCINCGEATKNPKFCGRSCAVSYNNRLAPKRTLVKTCAFPDCSEKIVSSLSYCTYHKNGRCKFKTLGELRVAANYQVHAYARYLAREWAKKNLDCSGCWYCGYSLHINVCHVIDLAAMPDETLIEDTFKDNVIILCKNHHWEFDNGYLNYAPETGFEPA